MEALQRLSSAWRNLFWLVRGSGLRSQLNTLDRRVSRAAHGAGEEGPSNASGAVLARLQAIEQQLTHLAHALGSERREQQVREWRRIGDLRGLEFKVRSQNGEDGILQEIFRRIGTRNRFFVEFGVETGVECNAAHLVHEHGWSGLFLEPCEAQFLRLQENYRAYPRARCQRTAVTSENIESILAANEVPAELDLLSIDVDGNDYWIWVAIANWRPRVVVIEYNAAYPPPRKWVLKEDPDYRWNGTNYHGASLASLHALGAKKGYALVGTDSRGVNAFFVRDDCIEPGAFLDSMLHYHYSPFGYPPHPPFEGPYVEV